MNTTNFKTTAQGHCQISKVTPDQKTIKAVLASAKKKPLKENAIVIARYNWIKKRKMQVPEDLTIPNLCLTIKDGNLVRAFYSETMTHVIKKLNYNIQVLNS
jgi:hypothetical protein